ncbi:efflux RND transporter periplasmic adaptor subunit [Phenylobacterium sp.]|jgi:HlyD family secretion protein|uniref:efflux RND transporter periplasmic adaptor subunit n=1 Tax=Phenylobacterium sp. TaxID=1871053 RepID=UPI002F41F36A
MTSSSHVSAVTASGSQMDRPLASPRRRRWLWIGGGGAAAATLLAGLLWLLPGAHSVAVKASEVQIATVRREPFQDYVPLRAEAAPLTQTLVTAVEGGQVEKVLVLDGSEVAAGQPLARLINPQLRRTVVAQEADIAGKLGDVSNQELTLQHAQADRERELAQAQYDLQKSKQELAKRQILFDQGIESAAALKTYSDDATYYTQRVAALQASGARESTMAGDADGRIRTLSGRLNDDLAAVEASLDALIVKAPTTGRLTNFLLQPGQALKAGDTVGQVDSEGDYKLTAEVDEFYLGRVAMGQAAVADLDGRQVPLRVFRVLPQVVEGRFHVEFAFSRPPPALRRGQSLDVRLILGDTHPAVTLPDEAWMESSGGAYAFVLRPDGRQADRRAIVVRRRNPEQVEVAQGLSPGERVVVSSYAGLSSYAHLILR